MTESPERALLRKARAWIGSAAYRYHGAESLMAEIDDALLAVPQAKMQATSSPYDLNGLKEYPGD